MTLPTGLHGSDSEVSKPILYLLNLNNINYVPVSLNKVGSVHVGFDPDLIAKQSLSLSCSSSQSHNVNLRSFSDMLQR